jgi:hypothetical protein
MKILRFIVFLPFIPLLGIGFMVPEIASRTEMARQEGRKTIRRWWRSWISWVNGEITTRRFLG